MSGRLAGRTVVVTRPAGSADALVELLGSEGASVIVAPLIEVVDEPVGLAELAAVDVTGFEWLVVTSRNAAVRVADLHGDALAAGHVAVAAVGTATAAAIGSCRLVPQVQSAVGLIAEMRPPPAEGGRVLVVHAVDAAPALVDGLTAMGWTVTAVSPYRSVTAHPSARQQIAMLAADAVLFASGSAARAWVEVFGTSTPPVAVMIGPQTAAAARGVGIAATAVAADHSLTGLVEALLRSFDVSG